MEMAVVRRGDLLCDYIIWIHNILPPVVMNPVSAPGGFREVVQPPLVMFTRIPMTPIS